MSTPPKLKLPAMGQGACLRKLLAAEASNLSFRVAAIIRGIRTVLPGGDEKLTKNDVVFVFFQSV